MVGKFWQVSDQPIKHEGKLNILWRRQGLRIQVQRRPLGSLWWRHIRSSLSLLPWRLHLTGPERMLWRSSEVGSAPRLARRCSAKTWCSWCSWETSGNASHSNVSRVVWVNDKKISYWQISYQQKKEQGFLQRGMLTSGNPGISKCRPCRLTRTRTPKTLWGPLTEVVGGIGTPDSPSRFQFYT